MVHWSVHGHLPLALRSDDMNQDLIQEKWPEIRNSMHAKFGKLTAEDLGRSGVNHQYLVGKLQERYGWQKDQAEREVRDFEKDIQKAA